MEVLDPVFKKIKQNDLLVLESESIRRWPYGSDFAIFRKNRKQCSILLCLKHTNLFQIWWCFSLNKVSCVNVGTARPLAFIKKYCSWKIYFFSSFPATTIFSKSFPQKVLSHESVNTSKRSWSSFNHFKNQARYNFYIQFFRELLKKADLFKSITFFNSLAKSCCRHQNL